MRHLCLLLSLTVATTALAEDREKEILQAEKEWATAVVALDFSKLDKIYHEGLVYAHSTGVIETKQQYLKKLRTGQQRYLKIAHDKTTVRVEGAAAVAHTIGVMKGTSPRGNFDHKLMIMHTWFHDKDLGRWRLVAHQTTRLD